MSVNKENMRKWVAALRSGEFKQGYGNLLSAGNYCCLGVACAVAISNGVEMTVGDWDGRVRFDGFAGHLPPKVSKWLGVDTSNPVIGTFENGKPITAFEANDCANWSFAQIADAIEQFYELEDGGNDGE